MSVLCLGEALVDFVADEAGVGLAECPGFRKAAGGAPGNVAVGLARLGVPSTFLGKVGEDPFGHFLEQSYRQAGVDTRFVRFDRDARTGLAFVALKADGDREFVFFRNPSADMLHRAEEVPDNAFAGCRVYHFGSISLIQEPSRGATLDCLRRARERGAIISYDPNLRPALWPNLETARRTILAALPQVDVVKVSQEEAEFLYGPATADEHAIRILRSGPRLVAITCGERGSFLATVGAAVECEGFPVEAVDTTGAGDAFMAGLINQLLQRGGLRTMEMEELREIGRYANAVGALTCTRKGAIPALPSADQVEGLLDSPLLDQESCLKGF